MGSSIIFSQLWPDSRLGQLTLRLGRLLTTCLIRRARAVGVVGERTEEDLERVVREMPRTTDYSQQAAHQGYQPPVHKSVLSRGASVP